MTVCIRNWGTINEDSKVWDLSFNQDSAELTHGAAIGQDFTVGWANIQSDCQADWFTAPNREPVSRSVVRVNYDIEVREIQGTLMETALR